MITEIKVKGERLESLPHDLYIPPDALEVFLEAFEGPLDLLLYLIQKENLDILELPMASITQQYKGYVELMKSLNLELAAEYLVMAAWLTEIKSRCLLPRSIREVGEEQDPRAELVRRLQEYEQIKAAAEQLTAHPQEGYTFFTIKPVAIEREVQEKRPLLELAHLSAALLDLLRQREIQTAHCIAREPLSVRERMSFILGYLSEHKEQVLSFYDFLRAGEGLSGVVVVFVALLELLKESLVSAEQPEVFGPLTVRSIVCH